MSSDEHRAMIGRTLAGKFLIESFVGGGAMGKVYRARQIALEKVIAVKVMHREIASDGMFAARFHREAKAASRLDHPNSMRVIDFGEEPDGLLYIAMEFLDGLDLFRVIQNEWPLAPARMVDILMQTLAALAVAHDMGVVHRDLKPENIMLQRGKNDEGQEIDIVKVCDFGIAKITDARADEESRKAGGAKLTTQGLVVGTPEYMSPEQGRGETLDARSDLYSMGVILYQMLSGRVPFEAESAIGIVLKHVSEEPVPPSSFRSSVDPQLEAICLKAMRKKREERYQTAREMRGDLRAIVDAAGAALSRAKTEPALATVVGTAPTVAALDSNAVKLASVIAQAEKSASKVTPLGTATLTEAVTAPKSRAPMVAMLVVAVAAGVGGTLYATRRASTAAPSVSESKGPLGASSVAVESAPRTTIAPLPLTNAPLTNAPLTNAPLTNTPAPVALAPAPKGKPGKPGPHGAAPSGASAGSPAAPSAPLPEPPPVEAAPSAPVVAAQAPAPAPSPTPPPASTPAPAAPPAAPFEPEKAVVRLGPIETTHGLPPSKVRIVLQRVHPVMTRCYRDALVAAGAPASGPGAIHFVIDDTGHVTSATLNGVAFLPSVRPCIESAARSLRFPDVDTGEATADVHLEFMP